MALRPPVSRTAEVVVRVVRHHILRLHDVILCGEAAHSRSERRYARRVASQRVVTDDHQVGLQLEFEGRRAAADLHSPVAHHLCDAATYYHMTEVKTASQ